MGFGCSEEHGGKREGCCYPWARSSCCKTIHDYLGAHRWLASSQTPGHAATATRRGLQRNYRAAARTNTWCPAQKPSRNTACRPLPSGNRSPGICTPSAAAGYGPFHRARSRALPLTCQRRDVFFAWHRSLRASFPTQYPWNTTA